MRCPAWQIKQMQHRLARQVSSFSVHADLSNFAMPEQQGQSMHPTIRQIRIEASTLAQLNKPTVIGVADDPNSKRQFQLEVTVTKLK